MKIKAIIFFILLLSSNAVKAEKRDSLFIADLKRFIYKEFGTDLNSKIYTEFDEEDKQQIMVLVSLPNKIEIPQELRNKETFRCNAIWIYDEYEANRKASNYIAMGYHVSCFKVLGTPKADLTERFLSYNNEAKSYILFHELTHVYVNKFLDIPYEFNESLADVIGNYGTLLYSQTMLNINITQAKRQIEIKEKLYMYINLYSDKINKHPRKAVKLDSKCQKKLKPLIRKGDLLIKESFNHKVNNAFLLQKRNYSKYYFLLKDVYLKQGSSIRKLLEIMKDAPKETDDIINYLKKFL